MYAMVLKPGGNTLEYTSVLEPEPKADEILIKVQACGVCRTDLHIIDHELHSPKLPLIPGHQIIGTVFALGKNINQFKTGDRVGVPWLGESCENCIYCLSQRENLCDHAKFTGYQLDGGFAQYCVAKADYCFPIPKNFPTLQAAPLLCAGLIGYRALSKTGQAKRIGLYGFGASAHIVTQIATHQKKSIFAFTRENDKSTQAFAQTLGAVWTGAWNESPPEPLEAAIIFAPEGKLVPQALQSVEKGGIVVCAGIHMSDIPTFPYERLWGEKILCSVANLTRQDGYAFFDIITQIPIQTTVHTYELKDTQKALEDLRLGKFKGAAVISLL